MTNDRAAKKLLNIDARNKKAITLFNPYGDALPARRRYRFLSQSGQARRSKSSGNVGRNK
jgi:hypothetical protein